VICESVVGQYASGLLFVSTRSQSTSSGNPAVGDSSIRHWHRSYRLPRFRRACPSTALDERVIKWPGSMGTPRLNVKSLRGSAGVLVAVLLGELTPNVVHIELANLADEVLES